jgi:eukaryotic-like serine/threonine-protein kinase
VCGVDVPSRRLTALGRTRLGFGFNRTDPTSASDAVQVKQVEQLVWKSRRDAFFEAIVAKGAVAKRRNLSTRDLTTTSLFRGEFARARFSVPPIRSLPFRCAVCGRRPGLLIPLRLAIVAPVNGYTASGYLPSDALERAGRRLSIAAVTVAAGWAFYTVLYLTVYYDQRNSAAQVIAGFTIAVSLWLAWHVRSGRCSHRRAMHLGLGYEVIICFAFWMSDYLVAPEQGMPSQISWVCAVILFFPALIPTTPRLTFITSLVSVGVGPLAFLLSQQIREQPIGDMNVVISLTISAFICSLLAYLPAHVVHHLGRDVSRARQLGSYQLVERLGAGGMGEVWRAHHRMLVRPAAIKLIRPGGAQSDAAKKRFKREAQITAALESPHTVELYDFGISDDGAYYYVMELLRGIDLETMVRRFGPLPPHRVVHLLVQACDSLDDAHRHGLVHRDVKPANLFLCKRGRHCDFVKVLDFGLVQVHRDHGDARATQEGTILGTPAFLAPEMATGDDEIDAQADIYALGCVAYYLLTGALVFEESSPLKTVIAHATAPPPPLSSRADVAIPASLESVVMHCLKKKPGDRPESAMALADALSACELGQPWSDAEAQAWWKEHLSSLLEGEAMTAAVSEQPTALLRPLDS